jgi:hypothetical protein
MQTYFHFHRKDKLIRNSTKECDEQEAKIIDLCKIINHIDDEDDYDLHVYQYLNGMEIYYKCVVTPTEKTFSSDLDYTLVENKKFFDIYDCFNYVENALLSQAKNITFCAKRLEKYF